MRWTSIRSRLWRVGYMEEPSTPHMPHHKGEQGDNDDQHDGQQPQPLKELWRQPSCSCASGRYPGGGLP